MTKSFKHKGLEDFFYTGKKKGIKPEHADRLGRILDRLNAASEIRDMNYPGPTCTSWQVTKRANML
jgi:proteic killer suppression protein